MASADDETREVSASNWDADMHEHENPRKKRKIVPTETASSVLMKYIIVNNKKQSDYKHPIDAFLEGLDPSLKNLPPYYQHLAKGIFSVVHEIGQAFFGPTAATPHSSRDPRENSYPDTEIVDNITALTPRQTSTLPSYYENSDTHSN
jgi:hypothetical protein